MSGETGEFDVSVVIPCLNEARTIGAVVGEALEGIRLSGLKGEVVVSDNGSTDGSQSLAVKAGARVVAAPIRGYGAALHYGIVGARGRWVLFGDADMSYDFRLLPRFREFILAAPDSEKGRDLVLGSRLNGRIEPGAMPFLNRHLGTPALNMVIRLFFGLVTSDCNSGMRLVNKSFYRRLPMRAPGMEWASELLIKAKIMGARYAEVPIVLRPDRRGRPPHLRRWRDGWRHLKTIVLLSPNRLILAPSVGLLALSALSGAFERFTGMFLFGTIGVTGVSLALLVKLVLHADGVRASRLVGALLERPFAEMLLASGVVLTVLGAAATAARGLEIVPPAAGALAAVAGAVLVLSSFAWGVLVTHCLKKLDQ